MNYNRKYPRGSEGGLLITLTAWAGVISSIVTFIWWLHR